MFFLFKNEDEIRTFPIPNLDPSVGAVVEFLGVVRNHHEGEKVKGLYYEAHESMVLNEGKRIFKEALEKFNIHSIRGWHRSGYLTVGERATKIIVEAAHRKEAFDACSYAVDEMKKRLPIWKKEEYLDGGNKWILRKHQ